jgi:site-specific DNA recombinase
MQSYNVRVISTTENLGRFDEPNAFLTELLTAGLGHHMVLQTRQKSIAGIAQKAKTGVFLGGFPPLGYDVEDGQYVINPCESEAVRLIFGMYANGDSYSDIINALTAKGWGKGKRGAPIGKTTINAMLKNERYIGIYTWNKHKTKYFGKWAGGEKNPDVVRIEDGIPAIITRDIWERVRKRMNNKKHNASNGAKNTYLLSGLIECGKCGGAFTGKTSTNTKGYSTRSYCCCNKYRTKTCDARNVNADELEATVVIQLKEYFSGGDFDTMAEEIFRAYTDGKSSNGSEKKEIAEINRQIANGTKAILAGADFSELNEEMARLKVRKAELEDILAISPETILTPDIIAEKLKADAQLLRDGDIARLIKSYVTKIYAHSDEIIITGGVDFVSTNHCGSVECTLLTIRIPFPFKDRKLR